jgi:carbon-monoxide dehydrogenase medium subunit
MKPVDFAYERPATLSDAIALLADGSVFAKPIAGSQSLGPMLNMRIAQPDLLVDITSIESLSEVADRGDHIEFGACVTHADIEDRRLGDVTGGLMPHVAGNIAYRAVRNRGTIGGSLAHADPAADWLTALPLLGAELVIAGPAGERLLPAVDILVSSFSNALEDGELIAAVRVPRLSKSARWGFYKFNQKQGEFAHAIGAVLLDDDLGRFTAVIGAIETRPIIVEDATALFGGGLVMGKSVSIDDARLGALLDGKDITEPHRRKLLSTCLIRAAQEAVDR